mmetsp:Transcript_3912/g.6159  ORF Transcript_3912/g.6159 Transcript_3912/m.6159 type:complete len:225 (-) Transcript_3912:27-701(-)
MNSKEFLLLIVVAVVAYWLGAANHRSAVSSSSEDVMIDAATGIEFPKQQSFSSKSKPMSLVGVGTRKKAIINVYSVGLFVSDAIQKNLGVNNKQQGADICHTIRNSNSAKAVQLIFAMGIGPEKIAEAMTQLPNTVDPAVTTAFQIMLVQGLGDGKLQKGESMSFEWKNGGGGGGGGSDTILVTARGTYIGEMKDKALALGVLDLYLGQKTSVSPSLLKNLGCK